MNIRLRPTLADRVLDAFPAGTYALHGLLSLLDIVESDEVPTAAVECRAEPRLLINPAFVNRHAQTPEKLLMLVMHELHHVLLGHTRLFPCSTPLDNFVFDAVINALLCRMFPAAEHTSFFTEFYPDDAYPGCFLRPPARWTPGGGISLPTALEAPERQAEAAVYRALYSDQGASYHDLYDIFRTQLRDEDVEAIALLGDHSGHSAAGDLEGRAPVLFEAVRTVVERWPQPPDPIRGRSLEELLKEQQVRPSRVRSNRSVLRDLLRRVAGTGRGGPVRRSTTFALQVETPVPTFDRRSTVLRSLGCRPLLYAAAIPSRRSLPVSERVHVYLDVSGSIGDLKGALYGAVLDCQELVHPVVHLFSTAIADMSFRGLSRGHCETTGGTDIGCVAGHMAEHRVRRAVFVTDGFTGRPQGAHRKVLAEATVGVALTPGSTYAADLHDTTNFWAQLVASSTQP